MSLGLRRHIDTEIHLCFFQTPVHFAEPGRIVILNLLGMEQPWVLRFLMSDFFSFHDCRLSSDCP